MTPQAKRPHLFSTPQWIAYLGALVGVSVALTAFAFQNFETKEDAKERKGEVIERLKRIEDILLDRAGARK